MNKVVKMKDSFIEGFNDEAVRVIKNMIDPSNKLKDEQLQLFLHVCKEKRLDPRTKQIYAVPRYNSHSKQTELTIQTSIDGFRLIAERTGRYAPGKPTDFLHDSNNKLIGATVYVKKYTDDGTWHDVSATAFLSEYKPSNNNTFWNKMPSVMIEKCAESRALRRAFPADFSGIYSEDEMHQAKTDEKVEPQPTNSVENGINSVEAEELDKLIGDDNVYRSKVMKFIEMQFKLKSFEGMPKGTYEKIKVVALKKYNERQEKALGFVYGEQEQLALGV